MKHLVAALLIGALPVSLTSCATTGGDGTVTSRPSYVTFISPAAAIATATVLDKAVSPDDRADKARLALEVAEYILLLTDTATTGEQISAAVLSKTGAKPHWIVLATTLADLFEDYKVKLGNNQAALIINKLALGIKAGAAPYAVS